MKYMRYLLIIFIFFSCNSPKVKTVEKYSNGNPLVTFNYPNGSDKSVFTIEVFYKNGKINRTLSVKSGRFVDEIVEYSESGEVTQIDSLKAPCDTVTRACDAIRTTFYDDGKIAERFNMQNGKYNGISQHYDHNGILVKEYYLGNNIKNGPYREYDITGKLDFFGTYKNDTLVGYCYFFNPAGDTTKYYFNEDGKFTFPYKKWLNDGRTLLGNYTSAEKKAVLWTWYKNGIKLKSKIVISNNGSFVAPE